MAGFTLERTETPTLQAVPPLSEMYTLSPFVWKEAGGWKLMVRAVPRRDDDPALKIACAYYGVSADGLTFQMDESPAISAGPDPADKDGCEDPTVAVLDGTHYVYYTGWNQAQREGNLLLASGRDPRQLEKQGVRLASSSSVRNPKEATIVSAQDGTWRLFFEYAEDDASKIGIASAPSVDSRSAAAGRPARRVGRLAPQHRAGVNLRPGPAGDVLQRGYP